MCTKASGFRFFGGLRLILGLGFVFKGSGFISALGLGVHLGFGFRGLGFRVSFRARA